MSQMQLFKQKEEIETVVIMPTKDMPLEVYKVCHHLAYFMELMERTDSGKVIWDEEVTEMYSEELAEAEYTGLQNDWFSSSMELPKVFVEENLTERAEI